MIRKLLLLAVAGISLQLSAQAVPTWSTDVAPILYNHCATCHHDGSIAPFSLLTYSDATANAYEMSADIQTGKMPPWPPSPSFSHMAHERLLTQAEKTTITDWITGGMPQGDLAQAPPLPVFSNTGDIPGIPDFIGQIPHYTSTADTSDVYQCFVIPSNLLTDKFITAFEAIPGNRGCVHHVLVYADTTGTCRHLDSMTTEPGYLDFGGVGTDAAILLGGWVPGSAPLIYPANFGVKLPHNADIVLQIHYPAGTAGQQDSTQVHFFFSPTNTCMRDVFIQPVLNHFTNINAPINIAANTTQWYTEHFAGIPADISLLGIAPHMHLLGKSITAFGITPALDTQKYISIPEWEFHWQGFYMLPQIMKIPANTQLYANAFYDNTTGNPDNPNSPPQDVIAGESTDNEMMIVYFVFSLYQPGDENVVIDSTITTALPQTYYRGQQLFQPYPNPVTNELVIKSYLQNADIGSIELLDAQGKMVRQLMPATKLNSGYMAQTYKVGDLPAGNYIISMKTSERILTQKILIQH